MINPCSTTHEHHGEYETNPATDLDPVRFGIRSDIVDQEARPEQQRNLEIVCAHNTSQSAPEEPQASGTHRREDASASPSTIQVTRAQASTRA